MKQAYAQLEWNLWIECPHCEYEFDLAQENDDGWVSTPIFNNKWDDLKGEEVECPECKKSFLIESVEY